MSKRKKPGLVPVAWNQVAMYATVYIDHSEGGKVKVPPSRKTSGPYTVVDINKRVLVRPGSYTQEVRTNYRENLIRPITPDEEKRQSE